MSLFVPKMPDRYNGEVTAVFKSGKVISFETNSNTTNPDYVFFMESIIDSLSSTFPDAGCDNLYRVAREYFVPASVPEFIKTMENLGIHSDREMRKRALDYDVVCSIIDLLFELEH